MSAVHEAVSNGAAIGGIDAPVLLRAMHALKKGDFSVRLPVNLEGMDGKIADAFNNVIDLNERMSAELERLSRVVGKEGKISQRASLGDVSGSWEASIASVNALIGDLVHPTSETARVIGAVAQGDLDTEGSAHTRRWSSLPPSSQPPRARHAHPLTQRVEACPQRLADAGRSWPSSHSSSSASWVRPLVWFLVMDRR